MHNTHRLSVHFVVDHEYAVATSGDMDGRVSFPMADRTILLDSLHDMLEAGRSLAATLRDAYPGAALEPRRIAEALASSTEAERANTAAKFLAIENQYGVRRRGNDYLSAGRKLTPDTIEEIGLATALCLGSPIDDKRVVCDLASYMSGPPIPGIHLVGIDASLTLSEPISIDGWELFAASRDDLKVMLPLPSLGDFQVRPWDPEIWAGLVFLRRFIKPDPVIGLRLFAPEAFPEWGLWRPLLVLSLVTPDVITMWTDHDVEPGRRIYKRLDRVYYEPVATDGEHEAIWRPFARAINLEQSDEPAFREQVLQIAALLPQEPSPANGSKNLKSAYARLKIAAQRLLAAGQHATGSTATPMDPVHATDALLHYVVALEALVGVDTRDGEIVRKISQRTAILAARNDTERIGVAREIRNVYQTRSRVIHGGAEPSIRDLEALRAIVRRVILGALVHIDSYISGNLIHRCDEALLSAGMLESLREPLIPFDYIT
ncbi:hypothetical protein [Actinopolymorpha pittospori]